MKIDLYTKAVLSVIAAALLWIAARDFTQPATALAQGPTKVIIAGIDSIGGTSLPVSIIGGAKYGTLRIDETNPLPVAVVVP